MVLQFATLVVALACATSSAQAQYASVAESEAQQAAQEAAKLQAMETGLIGTQFWVVPNPKAIQRLEFQTDTSRFSKTAFVLTEKTSFTVVGYSDGDFRSRYVGVVFPDGKTAYPAQNVSFKYDPKKTSLFPTVAARGQPCSEFAECVFADSPEDLRKAEMASKSKAAAAAAAWKARGGVSIGMTAAQVRASNWGRPQTINRSSGRYGTHEQWVYGGHNYLYLQNGVVTSIQN
jgi:hypothetical protein